MLEHVIVVFDCPRALVFGSKLGLVACLVAQGAGEEKGKISRWMVGDERREAGGGFSARGCCPARHGSHAWSVGLDVTSGFCRFGKGILCVFLLEGLVVMVVRVV